MENIIFISYDIVNSTKLKFEEDDWAILLERAILNTDFIGQLNGFKIFKYLGDEIILYKKISNSSEILDDIDNIFNVLTDTNKRGNDKIMFKATAWLASFGGKDSLSNKKINIPAPNGYTEDFLGKHMDEGFRIAKLSKLGRLVISAELGSILFELGGNDKIHFIGFHKFKGVWNNNFYPILWYGNYDEKILNNERQCDDYYNFTYLKYFSNEYSKCFDNLNYLLNNIFKVNKINNFEELSCKKTKHEYLKIIKKYLYKIKKGYQKIK